VKKKNMNEEYDHAKKHRREDQARLG